MSDYPKFKTPETFGNDWSFFRPAGTIVQAKHMDEPFSVGSKKFEAGDYVVLDGEGTLAGVPEAEFTTGYFPVSPNKIESF